MAHIYLVKEAFTLFQKNGWTVEVHHIEQQSPDWNPPTDGTNAERFKSPKAIGRPRSGAGRTSNNVTGRTRNDSFRMEITWNDGKVGVYQGTFDAEGQLSGITFNKGEPHAHDTWTCERVFVKAG